MRDDGDITPEDFDRLLRWLDREHLKSSDAYEPERAGAAYEKIRRRLIAVCASRGCREAEECSDEVLRRVTRKVCRIDEGWDGNDPVSYFLAVLDYVLKEYWRRRPAPPPPPPLPPADESAHACLDACMGLLPPEQRGLLLRYYQGEQRAKIDHRRQLADELGVGLNALRIRVHRLRGSLAKCVRRCLDERAG